MMNTNILTLSALALTLTAAPFSSAEATGDERHHYAPIQSGVKINQPVLSPLEEKITEIRNGINSLRNAKTSRERNKLLNEQAASLDALEVMLKGNSGNDTTTARITQLERRVEQLHAMIKQLHR